MNKTIYTLAELVQITQGQCIQGDHGLQIRSFFTDSRTPLTNGAFIAITGERFDGHDYVPSAMKCATAALVSRLPSTAFPNDKGLILVDDTREAYLRLAAAHRMRFKHIPWFAVTGSAGKTSVKELLAHLLEHDFPQCVHRARGSFNNEIGLPATILGVDQAHKAVVLELGTNHPGEIERLTRVARPNVAMITNVGPCHLEHFGTVAAIATEKGAILDRQNTKDFAILNADDPFFEQWKTRARGQVCSVGIDRKADIGATRIVETEFGSRFELTAGYGQYPVELHLPGVHNIRNALTAFAAAFALDPTPTHLKKLCQALGSFRGAERRFQVHRRNGIDYIDDAYNASPLSFKAGLDAVTQYLAQRSAPPENRRLFIVAGDMLELGLEAPRFHEEVCTRIATLPRRPEELITVGPLMQAASEKARALGLQTRAVDSPEDAATTLSSSLKSGDVVYIKGSNGIGLKRCLAQLLS